MKHLWLIRNEMNVWVTFSFRAKVRKRYKGDITQAKWYQKHEKMGIHSLFRQHTHLIHPYDSPCQCSSRKDTGASCLSHTNLETLARAQADMAEHVSYMYTHSHTRETPWSDMACRTHPCCMFLPEHTQQCRIPLLCKPCDWPKVSPKGPLTSYLVSQLQTWHRAQSCHHPLCRLLGKPSSLMVMVKACRMGKVFKLVLGGDEL